MHCNKKWNYTEFSQCTKSCGIGIQTREVTCIHESHVVERPASLCSSPRPAATKSCNSRPCLLDTASPEISLANSSYIQHDPKKKKVGGSATIFYGTQVKIKCPVKGYNRTKIQWAKDHQIISKSKKYKISRKGALRINSLSLRDHGVYTCVAGRSSANLTLLVKPRPGEFPSSEEIERHKALDEPSSPLSDSRADGRYRAMIGGTSDDQSHEQRPGDSRKNYKNRQKGKIDKVRDALYGNTATTSTKASPSFNSQERERDLYDEHEMFWNFQGLGNSRGQRTVDSIIMYQNYGVPTKSHFFNLEDKQMVFPEDDDSDIIIVNEDYNRNVLRDVPVENLKDSEETTTEHRLEAPDAHEYVWMTTDWSPCSALCSQTGHQIRGAVCQSLIAINYCRIPKQHKKDNSTTTVETEECLSRGGTPPTVVRECIGDTCAEWRTAPWSAPKCPSSGAAIIRRRVECVAVNGSTLQESACDSVSRPEKIRRDTSLCKATWAVGPWSKV
ncbi:hypothetical protein HF086_011106 [Spodoptera exigua]|uniref:Ig-like domain-containing protein n=1 Tax=Spodoptera exigua TaxID=7107 RepID=A0A922SFC4_SPOEX|nr:hypothetical protein HF086_011106 [Spodoptera exigua]